MSTPRRLVVSPSSVSEAGAARGSRPVPRTPVSSAWEITLSRELVDERWDDFVDATPGGHHLQTSLWAQVKAGGGWKPLRLLVHRDQELVGGAQVLVRSMRFGAIGYCPRGPLLPVDDLEATDAFLRELANTARAERILYVKLQPPVDRADMEQVLVAHGFVAGDMQVAPMASVCVDLRRPLEDILAGMRSATRQKIRKAERKGIVVMSGRQEAVGAFGEMLAATGRRQSFSPYPVEYYAEILERFGERRAVLLIASHDGMPLSGAVLIGFGDTAVYKMGAWSGEHTDLRPNELLHWHGIQWAKERGFASYDLDGISPPVAQALVAGDEPPESIRGGTTFFKLGLGKPVVYPSTYDRSFHRLLAAPARIVAPRLYRIQSLAGQAHRLQGRISGAR